MPATCGDAIEVPPRSLPLLAEAPSVDMTWTPGALTSGLIMSL